MGSFIIRLSKLRPLWQTVHKKVPPLWQIAGASRNNFPALNLFAIRKGLNSPGPGSPILTTSRKEMPGDGSTISRIYTLSLRMFPQWKWKRLKMMLRGLISKRVEVQVEEELGGLISKIRSDPPAFAGKTEYRDLMIEI